MVWDRETEDSEHRARRLNAKITFRQRLGHAKISESEWQDFDLKIDAQFEKELRTPQETEYEQEVEENQVEIEPESLKEAVQEVLATVTDSQQEVNDKKLEVLKKIEGEIEKDKTLDAMILENSKLRTQLEEHYALAQKQFQADRIRERENYRKGLEAFFGNLFEILTSFSDSNQEQSLILVFNRQGSVIGLTETLASKKVIAKGEIKIEGVD